jgi:hypothetical protein
VRPGHHLVGFDLRVGCDRWLRRGAVCGPLIGEARRPGDLPFPAKNRILAGAQRRRDGALAFIEETDRSAAYAGVAHSRFIHTDGDRCQGRRPDLGAEGNAKRWAADALLPDHFASQASAVLRSGVLNESGAGPTRRLRRPAAGGPARVLG